MNTKKNLLATARNLIRSSMTAVLSTQLHGESWPYGSLVLAACTHDASPLLLISELAAHTQSIASDNRISLVYDGTKGLDNPLSGPRVTILGRATRDHAPSNRSRFLSRHPTASTYVDFGDFGFHRISVERAHLVLGFGEIHWLNRAGLTVPKSADQFATSESAMLTFLNAKHPRNLALLAEKLAGESAGAWHAIGSDPDGLDLKLGSRITRINFSTLARSPGEIEDKVLALCSEVLT